jgi:hypothetical protein
MPAELRAVIGGLERWRIWNLWNRFKWIEKEWIGEDFERFIRGGYIILTWSKCLNNEFTEDKRVVMYRWLSLHRTTRCQNA